MYAVVDIYGFQYRIEKGETLRVPQFDCEVGSRITISEVLLVTDGDRIEIGTPFVEGAEVEATVVGKGKDKKIIVFKKKKRRDYSVKRGHRQNFTEIMVDNILIKNQPIPDGTPTSPIPGDIH